MADVLTPLPPAAPTTDSARPSALPANQPQQTNTLQTNQAERDAVNNASFLREVALQETENDTLLADQTTAQNDISANESLLNLDTSTLALLNEVGTDPRNPNVVGNLTAQQMQTIDILQKDIEGLQEANNANDLAPLTNDSVDLSAAAQDIVITESAPGATAANTVSTAATPALTTEQLEQIGAIFAPFSNVPLTPAVLLQIQNQLAELEIAQPLNLNTIFMVMSYMAGLQPAAFEALNARNPEAIKAKNAVAPVVAVDEISPENTTIQT